MQNLHISAPLFSGCQGIALRSHRDDSTFDDLSLGKFKALVNFQMEYGNELLQTHVGARGAISLPLGMQNEDFFAN